MQTEYGRQTRWSDRPESVDPDHVPPGRPYVKQVVWMPCNQCDLQVHVTRTHFLMRGLSCPECGDQLAPPTALPQSEGVARVLQEEQMMQQQVEKVKLRCSD